MYCILVLNDDVSTTRINNYTFNSFENSPEYNIGHKYMGNNRTNEFIGFINCLSISCRLHENVEEIKKYYMMTKEQILYDLINDSNDSLQYVSSTSLKISNTYLDDFKIYPLINDVKSIDGDYPKLYFKKIINDKIQTSEFKFNKENGHSSFVADGPTLIYDFGINNEGTIMFKSYTNISLSKQYLFEAKDIYGKKLGLYRGSDNKLYVNYNGIIKNTGLLFTNNEWHNVAFSFYKPDVSSTYYDKDYVYVRIILDNSTCMFRENPIAFDKLLFSIGKDYTYTSNIGVSYYTDEYFPFYGQIEMLCVSQAFCEVNTLKEFFNELYGRTFVKKYDEFNKLVSKEVFEKGEKVLTSNLETLFNLTPANNKIINYLDSLFIK